MTRRTGPRIARGRGVTGLLVLLLLTACPSRSTPNRPEPPPPAAIAGEIRVAYPWEPATLNPFIRTGDAPATRELVRPLMPGLFRLLPGGKFEPWLADAVASEAPTPEAPTEIRLHLRDDAVWSDGAPITVGDVIFTWRTVMDTALPIASRDGYDLISAIDEPTPRMLRMRFSAPMPSWRDLFSAGLGVLPSHSLKQGSFASALRDSWPVSGGSYVLVRYIRGLEMIFEASPHPWAERPAIKRIRVQFVPDSTTALALYDSGKVDVLGPYSSPDLIRRLRERSDARVSTDVGATWFGMVLRTTSGPLQDQAVRRAIAEALDRDGIVAGLVRAEGERLHIPFAEPRLPSGTAETAAAPLKFDADRASRDLDAAGWQQAESGVRKKGSASLTISLATVSSDDLSAHIARAMYERLRSSGIELSLVDLDYEELWRDWLPSGRLQAALVRMVDPPGGAIRARYGSSQKSPKGVNYSLINDTPLDAANPDPSIAAGRLASSVPVIPLYRATVTVAARTGLTGVAANASADGFLGLVARWHRAA